MDWIGVIGGLAGAVSALVAIPSMLIAIHEWRKIKKKIAMLTDVSAAIEVVPAWYTERMMQDDWLFGLLTSDGRTIAIRKITAISDNGNWMDVELATHDEVSALAEQKDGLVIAIAQGRRAASIQIQNIAAAMELQTS